MGCVTATWTEIIVDGGGVPVEEAPYLRFSQRIVSLLSVCQYVRCTIILALGGET